MKESRQHHALVEKGAGYIKSQHLEIVDIQIDEYSDLGESKVLYYLQYEPDIVGQGAECVIIGEAKTENDVLSGHSKRQYECYLQYSDLYGRPVYFYLFVPWKVKASANNYLKNLCKKKSISDVRWAVISEVELVDF